MGAVDPINDLIKTLKAAETISAKNISDGYHTFGELYAHRIILFSIICNQNSDLAWKSLKHFDNENDPMFENSFVAGIATPLGEATYHIDLKYWDFFNVKELEHAPRYDGHNSNDTLIRLMSLGSSLMDLSKEVNTRTRKAE